MEETDNNNHNNPNNNNNTKTISDDRIELGLHQSLMLAVENAFNHLLGIPMIRERAQHENTRLFLKYNQ
jgi:hypothetical protein